jgi:uncharacterized membrane protein
VTARRVEAGQGWAWIVEGWRLFLKAPGLWIVMFLIYIIIGVLLSFIPLVGGLVYTLAMPALMGGMIYGAAALSQSHALEISHLFRAFQDQERLGPMLILGALLVVVHIIIGLTIGGIVAGWMMGGTRMPVNEPMTPAIVMNTGTLLGLLVLLLIGLVIAMALFYAIPLVMLGKKAPWPSIQESFSACLTNIVPFLVFGLVYLVLAFLAAIPFGLGFFVLGPVTFAAVYASYRDVFPDKELHQVSTLLQPPIKY